MRVLVLRPVPVVNPAAVADDLPRTPLLCGHGGCRTPPWPQQQSIWFENGLDPRCSRTVHNAVGAIGLWLQNMSAGCAMVGYSVAPTHRGRGIATSALKALIAFTWTVPTLHRIELYIEPWNSNSSRVAETSGFQLEGLLRSHQEIGDTRRDMLLYATTRL